MERRSKRPSQSTSSKLSSTHPTLSEVSFSNDESFLLEDEMQKKFWNDPSRKRTSAPLPRINVNDLSSDSDTDSADYNETLAFNLFGKVVDDAPPRPPPIKSPSSPKQNDIAKDDLAADKTKSSHSRDPISTNVTENKSDEEQVDDSEANAMKKAKETTKDASDDSSNKISDASMCASVQNKTNVSMSSESEVSSATVPVLFTSTPFQRKFFKERRKSRNAEILGVSPIVPTSPKRSLSKTTQLQKSKLGASFNEKFDKVSSQVEIPEENMPELGDRIETREAEKETVINIASKKRKDESGESVNKAPVIKPIIEKRKAKKSAQESSESTVVKEKEKSIQISKDLESQASTVIDKGRAKKSIKKNSVSKQVSEVEELVQPISESEIDPLSQPATEKEKGKKPEKEVSVRRSVSERENSIQVENKQKANISGNESSVSQTINEKEIETQPLSDNETEGEKLSKTQSEKNKSSNNKVVQKLEKSKNQAMRDKENEDIIKEVDSGKSSERNTAINKSPQLETLSQPVIGNNRTSLSPISFSQPLAKNKKKSPIKKSFTTNLVSNIISSSDTSITETPPDKKTKNQRRPPQRPQSNPINVNPSLLYGDGVSLKTSSSMSVMSQSRSRLLSQRTLQQTSKKSSSRTDSEKSDKRPSSAPQNIIELTSEIMSSSYDSAPRDYIRETGENSGKKEGKISKKSPSLLVSTRKSIRGSKRLSSAKPGKRRESLAFKSKLLNNEGSISELSSINLEKGSTNASPHENKDEKGGKRSSRKNSLRLSSAKPGKMRESLAFKSQLLSNEGSISELSSINLEKVSTNAPPNESKDEKGGKRSSPKNSSRLSSAKPGKKRESLAFKSQLLNDDGHSSELSFINLEKPSANAPHEKIDEKGGKRSSRKSILNSSKRVEVSPVPFTSTPHKENIKQSKKLKSPMSPTRKSQRLSAKSSPPKDTTVFEDKNESAEAFLSSVALAKKILTKGGRVKRTAAIFSSSDSGSVRQSLDSNSSLNVSAQQVNVSFNKGKNGQSQKKQKIVDRSESLRKSLKRVKSIAKSPIGSVKEIAAKIPKLTNKDSKSKEIKEAEKVGPLDENMVTDEYNDEIDEVPETQTSDQTLEERSGLNESGEEEEHVSPEDESNDIGDNEGDKNIKKNNSAKIKTNKVKHVIGSQLKELLDNSNLLHIDKFKRALELRGLSFKASRLKNFHTVSNNVIKTIFDELQSGASRSGGRWTFKELEAALIKYKIIQNFKKNELYYQMTRYFVPKHFDMLVSCGIIPKKNDSDTYDTTEEEISSGGEE